MLSQSPTPFRAIAIAELRAAAAVWVTGEFDSMRRQGLNYWASADSNYLAHWELPLRNVPADVQAHLSLALSDHDGKVSTPWRLVWQIEVDESSRRGPLTKQVNLGELDQIAQSDDELRAGVEAILSLESEKVLMWAANTLDSLGYELERRSRD